MAGSGVPRYDNNGRHGSCNTTRLACTVEHDHITGPHDNPKLPSIVSQLTSTLRYGLMNSLGYSSSPATDLPTPTALHVTRPRKQDRRQKKVTRSVFLCYVLGATGSGKTSLLRSFVNRNRGEEYEPTTKVLSVVNSVEMEGVEKYLVVSLTPSFDGRINS
jgi:hypothetical protein